MRFLSLGEMWNKLYGAWDRWNERSDEAAERAYVEWCKKRYPDELYAGIADTMSAFRRSLFDQKLRDAQRPPRDGGQW